MKSAGSNSDYLSVNVSKRIVVLAFDEFIDVKLSARSSAEQSTSICGDGFSALISTSQHISYRGQETCFRFTSLLTRKLGWEYTASLFQCWT